MFDPGNGLASVLADSLDEPDVVLPSGARIDTELGVVQDSTGATINVKTVLVPQDAGQPSIFALEGKSFIVNDVTVSGTNAVAFVAPGEIAIRGKLDASAHGGVAGPGAQGRSAVCTGASTDYFLCSPGQQISLSEAGGGGGGGNATPGGSGGASDATIAPGTLVPTFVPLVGGCGGGNVTDPAMSTIYGRGGGGGGAIELVSETSVLVTGVVNIGGGGGQASGGSAAQSMGSGGGGSAGLLVVYAPSVELRGPGGVVANGGAGGGCGVPGADGSTNGNPATNATCGMAGQGGTGTSTPTAAANCVSTTGHTCFCGSVYGGGGGAAGRIHLVTMDASFMATAAPLMSAAVTTASLAIK